MIYDFGCDHNFLKNFLPAFGGAAAVLLVTIAMATLGAMALRRSRFRVTDIFCGWGIVASFMTLVAVTFAHALLYAALLLAAIMILSMGRAAMCGYFKSSFWLLALFPGLVILTAINCLGISGWDDFSHWVPNALYIFHYDSVPGLDTAVSRSAWPSYPYGVPFVTYLASRLIGGFLMQGGAMFNFLLLLAFGFMLSQTHLPRSTAPKSGTIFGTMGLAAFALVLVTLANPGFNASFIMTNQGDTSTMILVGALGLLLWQLIDALKQFSRSSAPDIGLQIALTAMALVLVKPVGIFLLGMLLFAFLVVAAKNKIRATALKNLPLLLLPALIMHFVWDHYVAKDMAGKGFGILPLVQWHFNLIGPILLAMLHTMIKDNGLFILTFLTIGAGVRSLFRPTTSLGNFALLSTVVCGGYIAFLFLTYVGSTFSDAEILRAASFYRYATHIGFLGTAFVWLATPEVWNDLKNKKKLSFITARSFVTPPAIQKIGIILLVSALPLALLIQSHWLIRGSVEQTCQYRDVTRKVAQLLPDHARLTVLDPESGGFFGYVVNFELAIIEARGGSSATVTQNMTIPQDTQPSELRHFFPAWKDSDAILIGKSATSQSPVLLLQQDKDWKAVTF